MERFVVDASAALAWLLNEPHGESVRQFMFRGQPVAPWLWRLEVANTLLVQERRKQISQADATKLLMLADEVEIEMVPEPSSRTLLELAHLARLHQLTSYDAVYLELAIAQNLPLLTLDKNLRAAAE